MIKRIRAALLIILVVAPIIFYKSLNKKNTFFPFNSARAVIQPQIALIFDDLGESLNDLKEIYSLGIPVTISIIPNLKFSKNIAHIASRCGLSVFIHLPLQPEGNSFSKSGKYRFINSDLSQRETIFLLRCYLNFTRAAIGVNNHMGSKATQDSKLMKIILNEIKKRGLSFVDSRTSLDSVAFKIAKEKGLICGYNEGFLDSVDDLEEIEKHMKILVSKAKEKSKIIIIAHPRQKTFEFLKKELPELKKEVEFINMKDYFEL